MNNGMKLTLTVAVLLGLGLAQWKYNLIGQIRNDIHPEQAQASDAKTAVPATRAPISQLVKIALVGKTDFPLIERGYGTMTSPQVVAINARITSQITKVNVQDGQMVKAGDVLIELDDRTLQAVLAKDVATLAKDQAVLDNNDIQLQRAKTLAARNAGPQQDVDNAVAAHSSQLQVIDSDKAVIDADKLQLDFAKIRAPFDGKLGAISAVLGALVSPPGNSGTQSSLLSITQMQPLRVTFRLAEQVLPPLQAALAKNPDAATVKVYASSSKDELDEGKLNFVDSSVDVTSGTIGLAANIGNAKLNLWPGQRVTVDLQYGTTLGAITVPTVAVQQGQIGSYVWVIDDQNVAKATPIKVSRFEGDLAEVSDGVTEGTKVVVEGQAKLANGTHVTIGGAETASAKPAASGTQP
ncbi:MAG TPA: efflux RND transporter periplasmic adaptor subunit [Aestuariivirga sp.]